mgnify:CR=1 FL=1
MSSTTVTRGNSHATFYIGPSLTPSNVAASVTATQTFSVPGLLTSDYVLVQGVVGSQSANIVVAEADVLTSGVLTIQFGNTGAVSTAPAAGVYVIQVTRVEGPLPANAA